MLTAGVFSVAGAEVAMPTSISRELVTEYFQAQIAREPVRLATFLDDAVKWSVTGPVDLLHFCGEWNGKQAVIDAIVRRVPSLLKVTGMDFEEILVDGERAATFTRLTAIHAGTGRTVSYRCAQFLRFSDGKLIEFRALIDSFDAAEQVLGHPINTSLDAPPAIATSGNRIAL
jgi:ketosteroid isomerase-like protein